MQGTGFFLGRVVEDGEGRMSGKTHTEPPFGWSIEACRGLNSFQRGQVLGVDTLEQPGMLTHTFNLEAIAEIQAD